MRELHGVVRFGCSDEQLKRQAVMFDLFHVVHLDHGFGTPNDDQKAAEWDALESLGIAQKVPEHFGDEVTMAELFAFSGYRSDASALDSYVRYAASKYADQDRDVVPICEFPMPSGPDPSPERARPGFGTTQTARKKSIETVLEVALKALPAPDESCSWEDILDFKAELHDKQWGFRRFLRSLSLKEPTESEVRDEIEWMINEYTEAMKVHNLKACPALKKRNVELLEAEMKAPGKECAYVFEARKRFGGS